MQRLNFHKNKRPSPPKLFIFDFDGTLTDVNKEAVPFVAGYKESLARRLGKVLPETEMLWGRYASKIDENPYLHGWKHKGKIVAPASADPFVMCRSIADLILLSERIATDAAERNDLLDSFFHENHGKLGIMFKIGLEDFLDYVRGIAPVVVVTNSSADKVGTKLAELDKERGCHHSDLLVYGNAKKNELDDTFTDVPEFSHMTGLARPVYLRRKSYAMLLRDLLSQFRLSHEEAAVFGDIYELDLALPAAINIPTALVPRPQTPDYEKTWMINNASGFVLDGLNLIG